MNKVFPMVAVTLASLLLAACDVIESSPTESSSPHPTPLATQTPTAPDTGWRVAGAGVETRELDVTQQSRSDRLRIVRVDPNAVTLRVRYDPAHPRRVGDWMRDEALRLVINGGFFDRDHRAQGLLIADGVASGQTYVGMGGLFGVQGGRVQVRSLILQPYRPGEHFDQMVQSFPMLLVGNGVINDQIRDDGDVAPRSVVGLDRSGRIEFLVSPLATFSLTGLAAWLAQSDLDLDAALNLDGGTSSGLVVRTDDGLWGTDNWVPVPAVIVAQ